MGKYLTLYRYCYGLFLSVILVLFFSQLRTAWLQTDLTPLLPQNHAWTEIQERADKIQEEKFNKKVIALVGHKDPERAFSLAKQIEKTWESSNLFEQTNNIITPDLEQLKQEISQLSLAILPKAIQTQLITHPESYFREYAEEIINPFQQSNLLSLDQDWLGFGRFALHQSQLQSAIQWDADTGMLFVKNNEITWVLLQGDLTQQDLINPQTNILNLIADNEKRVTQQDGQFLVTGSALFANATKQQAEQESTTMSIVGISLTLLLLLIVFRTFRVLWLFTPILVGVLGGIVITVFTVGHIHILTLVIGTSLVGVLIDFPLHWLASSLFHQHWNGQKMMEKLCFPFFISLIVTLIGYILLGVTSLPILQQTALFSATALIFSILFTLLFLPLGFIHYQSKNYHIALPNLSLTINPIIKWSLGFILFLGVGLGIYRSEWKDDIRQWVALPEPLLLQAKKISDITKMDLGSQYFLLIAENDQKLLEQDQVLSNTLASLKQHGKVDSFQSLSQWIHSEKAQKEFIVQLNNKIKQSNYAVFSEIGIPTEYITNAIQSLPEAPIITLTQALNTQIGQAWKTLYLGEIEPNKVASIVKLSGMKDIQLIQSLENSVDIYWQDKRSQMNNAFERTRNEAGWLKLLSFLFAGLLLWKIFGIKNALKMLAVPLTSIIFTIAIFGWFSLPITLFTMFGLLLVSAITLDYTVYMKMVDEPLSAKHTTITLAAITTLISFSLLGISTTPAIASFGLSVSMGILFSLFVLFKTLR
ncbi:MMPL family transporter [Otariodibacter oris]|uniref:Putative exporter n=1 Tax=Otariodibacter oris TaxID=1032623 RepID=A0A420XGQ1_9PAST|nr:hypothetical protein [Otariodibacter oris]QGM79961.1 hypothetical protein A6A10_00350 [Otariodibacter oris]RKR71783.1 putative exporter [Otariodibacter oris]